MVYILHIYTYICFYVSGALTQSQFPVFTIYAQKSCLAVKPCERAWCIDRVQGHRLQGHTKRSTTASSRQHCLELCLGERDFLCRWVMTAILYLSNSMFFFLFLFWYHTTSFSLSVYYVSSPWSYTRVLTYRHKIKGNHRSHSRVETEGNRHAYTRCISRGNTSSCLKIGPHDISHPRGSPENSTITFTQLRWKKKIRCERNSVYITGFRRRRWDVRDCKRRIYN